MSNARYDVEALPQKILSRLLSVTRKSIHAWTLEGMPRNGDGSYSGPACVRWLLDRLENRYKSSRENTDEPDSKFLEKYREERWRLARIERQMREEKIVLWSQVEEQWNARVLEVTAGLEAFADRLSPLLVGEPIENIRAIIKSEVWILREAYAREGTYTPAVAAAIAAERGR